jgi:hypothetical protein
MVNVVVSLYDYLLVMKAACLPELKAGSAAARCVPWYPRAFRSISGGNGGGRVLSKLSEPLA